MRVEEIPHRGRAAQDRGSQTVVPYGTRGLRGGEQEPRRN